MKFSSEYQPKRKGRKPGANAKRTKLIRDAIADVLSDNRHELANRLTKLSDRDFVKAYTDLSKFVIPQLRASEVKIEEQPIPEHLDYLLNASDKEITKAVENDIQRI